MTGNLATGIECASTLVAVTTELLDELDRDPHRNAERDVELISVLRVYRNAAFVFRRLVGVSGDPDPALWATCAAMIEQGHDHLRALTGQAPDQDESTG